MTAESDVKYRRSSLFVPNEVAVGHTATGSYLLDISGSSKHGYNLANHKHEFTGSIEQSGSAGSHFMDKVGIGLYSPLNMALTISGSAVSYQGIASPDYATGFAGYGYAWVTQSTDQKWHLMTDNLTVRGLMNIYELLIHQVRATNGSIWVSNSGKIESASLEADSTWTLFFDTGSDYGHTFLNGDIIRAQRWDAAAGTLYQSDMRIILVESARIATASLNAGSTEPTGGMEYVRMGNEFTVESASRQGAIYLTADDTDAPYIDVIDDITTHSDFNTAGTIKMRMGKLTGFSDADYGTLSGYGLYATGSVWLKGGIIATFGKLGGWMISSTYISSSDERAIIDSSIPKLAFGSSANTMDVNSGSTGIFISGSGEFRFGGVSSDFLKYWDGTFEINGVDIDIEATNFHLSASGLEISSSDSSINLRNLILISGSDIPIIKLNGGIISASNFYVSEYGNLTASNAYISGIISSSVGNIGGWTINSQNIQATSNGLMLSSSGVVSASNFYVDAEGHLTASSAMVYGILSASVGNIGGWTINAGYMKSTTDHMMLSGSGVISASYFYVNESGSITASNAIVYGTLSASVGNIGGWEITGSRIGSPGTKYLSLNSASSSLYVYPELGNYTSVVRVGNFDLSPTGSASYGAGLNQLQNYDFTSEVTLSWSGSDVAVDVSDGFYIAGLSWRHTASLNIAGSGSLLWSGARITGSELGGYNLTASVSQTIGQVVDTGDYVVAGCSLARVWSGGTASVAEYEKIELQFIGRQSEGDEYILASQSVNPPLLLDSTGESGKKSDFQSYGLVKLLGSSYDNFLFKVVLQANPDGVPGGTSDPPKIDAVLPAVYIDDTYLQQVYGLTEICPDGIFIQRSPANYIRSDVNEFLVKGAILDADDAYISDLYPTTIHQTRFDNRVDFDAGIVLGPSITGSVGINTTAKSSVYGLTIGGIPPGGVQQGGLLIKNSDSSYQPAIRSETTFYTASIGLVSASQVIVPGLTLTTARFGLWVQSSIGAAIVATNNQGGTAYRTLFTSGALAEFQNDVIISGSGLCIGDGFQYNNYPTNRTIMTSGSLAEFQSNVIIGSGSKLAIGWGFSDSVLPTHSLIISQSSSTAYTSYFTHPSGSYIFTKLTGSMIRCAFGDATGSELATVGGIEVFNTSSAVGSLCGYHLYSESAYAGMLGRRVGSNQQAIDFYTENTSRTVKVTIGHDGRVGIGMTNPIDLLEVRGRGNFTTVSASGYFIASSSVGMSTDIAIWDSDITALHHLIFAGGILVDYYTE